MGNFKRFIEENINGILGTIIFHLVLLNAFFFIQMSSLKSKKHVEFEIQFEEMLEDEELLPKDEKQEFIEEELSNFSNEMRSNIAVNEANQNLAEEISSENFEQEIMNELNMEELFPDNESGFSLPEEKEEKKENKKTEQKEYAGPTNITYNLENRTKRYLHIPVYQCQGGGTVKLNIVVDQRGFVVSAAVNSPGTTANSECLEQAALNAANRSRFNTDYNATNRQKGTITYQFVSQ